MNKNIRDKINYAVEIINSIETDNLEKAKEINQLYDNIGEEESFNVNNMLLLYFKNIFINKKYNLFNNTFFYYIENLRTFKTDNIHLYYSIFYNLATLPREVVNKNYTLETLIDRLENDNNLLNTLNDYDFECLISTCLCRNLIDLTNRANSLMLIQENTENKFNRENYI